MSRTEASSQFKNCESIQELILSLGYNDFKSNGGLFNKLFLMSNHVFAMTPSHTEKLKGGCNEENGKDVLIMPNIGAYGFHFLAKRNIPFGNRRVHFVGPRNTDFMGCRRYKFSTSPLKLQHLLAGINGKYRVKRIFIQAGRS